MLIGALRKALKEQAHLQTFSMLYGEEQSVAQISRYLKALEAFQTYFKVGDETEISVYSAPGRTEIGGNHTDHQKGRVVAASVGLDIIAFVMKATGPIRLKSEGFEEDCIDLSDLLRKEQEKNTSAALIRGIAANFKNWGFNIGGFHAYTTSDVFKGSGLSSSAAFETLVGCILNYEYNDGRIDPVAIAQAGQYAENVYFGKPCGLMDQAASSVGGFIAIDFKDPEKPVIEKIPEDLSSHGYALYIVDTGGNHADLTDDYADIPSEMKQVASFFDQSVLREVSKEQFLAQLPELRKHTSDRGLIRALHFFNENERAKEEAEALKRHDIRDFLSLVRSSGQSSFCYLQNIFSPHNPHEQGLSLALALSQEILGDEGAYRVHGGGFAGTIQAFVPQHLQARYESEMNRSFGGNACHKLQIRPMGACKIV